MAGLFEKINKVEDHAYASRYLAKNIVASKNSDKCLIQLAYAIGCQNHSQLRWPVW